MAKWYTIVVAGLALILGGVLGIFAYHYWSSVPRLSQPSEGQPLMFRPFYDRYVADAIAGHAHPVNTVEAYEWSEHPGGQIRKAYNNLGFAENSATNKQKGRNIYRILVSGDSHIDGWVNNDESFPNRLENLLNSSVQGIGFEVINGAVEMYGPFNHVGFLRKYFFPKAGHVCIGSLYG